MALTAVISVLSLIVAALAVFVGPIISARTSAKQLSTNLIVSNKQIIAPMRQVWINNLRDQLSLIATSALHYYVSGFEDRTDEEYHNLVNIEYKIEMMLNAREDDHQRLEALIAKLTDMLSHRVLDSEFFECHRAVVALSRQVLKREWDVVKEKIPEAVEKS